MEQLCITSFPSLYMEDANKQSEKPIDDRRTYEITISPSSTYTTYTNKGKVNVWRARHQGQGRTADAGGTPLLAPSISVIVTAGRLRWEGRKGGRQ